MKKLLLICCFSFYSFFSFSQGQLTIDPNIRYQTFEGWGVSLAWWANIAGGWSDAKIDSICTWLTSPQGLNMNVFRFNIAGEENPAHNHFRYSAKVPGYKVSEFAAYDYTRDTTQRKILMKLKQKRNDCIFEAVCYSPPYWMTETGCTAGGADNGSGQGLDNLKDAYIDDFADYLTTVVKYYHDYLGITFRTLAPINEPSSTWWLENGPQAGCHYSAAKQVAVFTEMYSKLQTKNMLSYCTLSGVDASKPQETVTDLTALVNAQIISKLTQVNTHDYSNLTDLEGYTQLYDLAKFQNKKLWVSEAGPLNVPGSEGFHNNLDMIDVLIRDMRYLKPEAWCEWQALSMVKTWGFIQFDSNATFSKVPNYYARMQLSRFIKPGYTMLHTSQSSTLAAINATNDTIALVINNPSLSNKSYTVDLSLFGSTGASAQHYRTTSGMSGGHYSSAAYQVTTYQIPSGLTNGTYTAKVWVRSGGGQTDCYLRVKDFGGTEKRVSIPRSAEWTQLEINNISVSNGQCNIGVYSNGLKDNWCEFDDIQLYLNSTPGTNVVVNGNFEQSDVYSQTIPSWSSSTSVASDFVQAISHSNNEECLKLSNVAISSGAISFSALATSINTLLIPVTVSAISPLSNGNYRITAKHSGKVMSVAGWNSTDGSVIEQWTNLNQSNQVFNIQKTPTGYKLLPSYNHKVVSVNGQSTSNGAAIDQWTDAEQFNQRFSIIPVGSGYYKIVSLNSGKCLAVTASGTANGDDVVQWEWLNQDNMKWSFTAVPLDSSLANGTYTIAARHSSKVMSIAASSNVDGAFVEQWSNLCQDNQKFEVTRTSAGYRLKPVYNSKLVTVANQSIANGAQVVQYTNTGISSQLFEIVSLGGGYYKIINRYTNKALAVNNNGAANGDDIVQWEWLTGYNNFQWSFNAPCIALNAVVEDDRFQQLKVYPNPAKAIQVEWTQRGKGFIEIYDISGKLRHSANAVKSPLIIRPSSALSPGIYFIKISIDNKIYTRKIILQ